MNNFYVRYHVKKDSTDVYLQSKKAYCVSRGITWTVQNKRPVKLKDKIKELEVGILSCLIEVLALLLSV